VHRRRVIQATIALSFGRIRKRLSASHQGRFGSANRGEIGFHSVLLDLLDQPRAKLTDLRLIGDRLATDDPIGKFGWPCFFQWTNQTSRDQVERCESSSSQRDALTSNCGVDREGGLIEDRPSFGI